MRTSDGRQARGGRRALRTHPRRIEELDFRACEGQRESSRIWRPHLRNPEAPSCKQHVPA